MVLCSSCSEPKIKLRAPQALGAERQVMNDTLSNDNKSIEKKKLSD